jgi:hypothetical protein
MYAATRVADAGNWNTRVAHIPRAVYVDRAYVGTEAGTRSRPYNTVGEGHVSSLNGNEIVLRTGTYPEAVTLIKAVTLIADGGSVVIGQ